ncbi:MAG: SDR family oxidoreductase [Candidatus Omnitrophica bacterium]|nr:SDR family oxidoreductase [Candidatus Omnitrophota bacterium]
MKILVTGAAGMLGYALCPILLEQGHQVLATDIQILTRDIQRLDVRDLKQVVDFCGFNAPDAVMHLAAETNLELCENDVRYAYLTNTIGTRNLAWVCRDLDIPMVYISSIGVFDGTKSDPYDENDVPNPINVYGRTKWAGEIIVESVLKKYFIVRAGWMIGGGEREKKFVALIIQQIRNGSRQIQVVTDKIGTPTYNVDFARGLTWLVSSKHYGTYNLSSGAIVSRYQVAQKILQVLGRSDVVLIGVTSDSQYIRDNFPTLRPLSETMRSIKTATLNLNCMRSWDVALEEYLKENYKEDIVALGFDAKLGSKKV